MARTPPQCVLLDFTYQPSPCPLPPSEGEYTRNSVYVYDDEGPYSDPAVYEIHLPGISSSVAYHTCPLYVLDLPCYCVIPVVAQTITPLVAVVHEYTRNSVHVYDGEEPYSDPAVYEIHLPGVSSSFVAHHTCPLYVLDSPCYCVIPVVAQTTTPQVTVVHAAPSHSAPGDYELKQLEDSLNASDWLHNNSIEPLVGDVSCHHPAEKYGVRGQSLFTAFVEEKDGGIYGCVYEPCFAFSTRILEEAIRHIRHHHFNYSPFFCGQCDRRFPAQIDLTNHQSKAH